MSSAFLFLKILVLRCNRSDKELRKAKRNFWEKNLKPTEGNFMDRRVFFIFRENYALFLGSTSTLTMPLVIL